METLIDTSLNSKEWNRKAAKQEPNMISISSRFVAFISLVENFQSE